MAREPVTLPAEVYVALETIRRSGEINMMDRRGVQSIANRRGFFDAVIWLEDNREAYVQVFFNGAVPDRDLTDDEQDTIEMARGHRED